jgi:hypothetical protein
VPITLKSILACDWPVETQELAGSQTISAEFVTFGCDDWIVLVGKGVRLGIVIDWP